MTDKKEKSLYQRFAAATKVRQEPGTFPNTPGIANVYPKAQAGLLGSMEVLAEVISDHVIGMERVKEHAGTPWANRWDSDYRSPILEHVLDVPADALQYHLTQFEGYKKAHEICGSKGVNVCVSLKQVERKFINTETHWAVVIDLSKPYSASPDAALFKKFFREEKKNAAKPAL